MMKTREQLRGNQIVRAASSALVVRSAAIVARGLRDLSRHSNWLIKRVPIGHSPRLAVSSAGQVAAVTRLRMQGTNGLAIYDIESGVLSRTLTAPGATAVCPPETPATLAWSATGQELVAAWGGWPRELHVFDLSQKKLAGTFGRFSKFPGSLAWSDRGKYFAAASTGGSEAQLRIWGAAPESTGPVVFSEKSVCEAGASAWSRWRQPDALGEPATAVPPGAEPDESAFWGFGCTAFSPDEMRLAAAVEMEGDWTDDAIVVLEMPSLRKLGLWHAEGHITNMSWSAAGRELIYCAAGQAFWLSPEAAEQQALPFGAELCSCHPQLPICLCFSSWLKSSAKGRLFLVDLRRLEVVDEHAAEGIADLCWSLDGSKAYAMTSDGLAYIYEPPPL